MRMNFIYLNDLLLEEDKAQLQVRDLAIQRGYGVFDFLRVEENVPLFLDLYLDRFFQSAALLDMEVPVGREILKGRIAEMIARNNLSSSGIKLILTGGYSPDGYTPGRPNLILMQSPLTLPPDSSFSAGVSIITHEYARELPAAKTINYITGIWLQKKLALHKAYDVLYHQGGVVSEFPRCNFFMVNADGRVVTPSHHILKGITRNRILSLKEQYPVGEGQVTLEDILQAKEAFLTSTTKGIIPVISMDGRPIGTGKPGEITLQLKAEIKKLEREELKGLLGTR